MSVQVSVPLSTHLSLRRDLLLDHVARHVGLQQLGLSATQIHVSRGADTSRHVSCDATWDPAAGLVFRVSYCKYYNHNHGDKQPNLDTGDIRARRR